MVSHGYVTAAACNAPESNPGQCLHQMIACIFRLVSSRATVGLQQGSACRSCFWLLAGAGLMMLPLVMVAALSLLDRKGGHHGQVLGKRRFLEPASMIRHVNKLCKSVYPWERVSEI